jgi:hypothetical protein
VGEDAIERFLAGVSGAADDADGKDVRIMQLSGLEWQAAV